MNIALITESICLISKIAMTVEGKEEKVLSYSQ